MSEQPQSQPLRTKATVENACSDTDTIAMKPAAGSEFIVHLATLLSDHKFFFMGFACTTTPSQRGRGLAWLLPDRDTGHVRECYG